MTAEDLLRTVCIHTDYGTAKCQPTHLVKTKEILSFIVPYMSCMQTLKEAK